MSRRRIYLIAFSLKEEEKKNTPRERHNSNFNGAETKRKYFKEQFY